MNPLETDKNIKFADLETEPMTSETVAVESAYGDTTGERAWNAPRQSSIETLLHALYITAFIGFAAALGIAAFAMLSTAPG